MRAAEMSGGVDHRGDHQPKNQSYADMSDLPTRDSVNDDGTAACEDKRKCPDAFGDTGRQEPRARLRRCARHFSRTSSLLGPYAHYAAILSATDSG